MRLVVADQPHTLPANWATSQRQRLFNPGLQMRQAYLKVLDAPQIHDPALDALDAGERSAIALGLKRTNFRYRQEIIHQILSKLTGHPHLSA